MAAVPAFASLAAHLRQAMEESERKIAEAAPPPPGQTPAAHPQAAVIPAAGSTGSVDAMEVAKTDGAAAKRASPEQDLEVLPEDTPSEEKLAAYEAWCNAKRRKQV